MEPRVEQEDAVEADICAKFITPALMKEGWSEVEQVFREYTLRPGRVVVQGRHSRRDNRSVLRADYALFYKTGMALAVIEAKDNAHSVGAGMQQAIGYAELLSVPFLLHVLPGGFHRIRHYGLLANSNRRDNLALARQLLQVAPPPDESAGDASTALAPTFVCRHCGHAMVVLQVFLRDCSIRAPPGS